MSLSMVLPACGGSSSSSGQCQIRFINASVGYSSLNFAVDTAAATAAVNYGAASGYGSYGAGTVTLVTNDATSSSLVTSIARAVTKDNSYTFIAYGWTRAVKLIQLSDNEAAANANYSKFRCLNLAPDAGALAIYLTSDTADLNASTPTIASVAGESVSGYVSIPSGTYRVRVTGINDPSDVRFDVRGVTLNSTSVVSLVLTPGASGILVQGLLCTQGSTVSALANTQARVRVVASVADNAAVSLSIGSTKLMDGLPSPTIGNYALVTAGSLALNLTVNGRPVSVPNLNALAGTDYTVLVDGPSAAPTVHVITEDNRLPLVSTNSRVRLVHAASSLAGSGLSMTVNYVAVAQSVGFGTASSYVEVPGGTGTGITALIDVTNPLTLKSVLTLPAASLVQGGLYTVFVLSTSDGTGGLMRKER